MRTLIVLASLVGFLSISASVFADPPTARTSVRETQENKKIIMRINKRPLDLKDLTKEMLLTDPVKVAIVLCVKNKMYASYASTVNMIRFKG